MPDSFFEFIVRLVKGLENSPTLQKFCQDRWPARRLTVKVPFKKRIEISLQDLPMILVTRPLVFKKKDTGHGLESTNRVRLYVGFYQPEATKALAEMTYFEELIEDVLITDQAINDACRAIRLGGSVNDEGKKHPSYFMAMDFDVDNTRVPGLDPSTLDDFVTFLAEYDLAPKDGQIEASDDITLEQ